MAELAHFFFTHDSTHEVVAFVADDEFVGEDGFGGLPIVPLSTVSAEFPPDRYRAFVALSSKRLNETRVEKYLAMKDKGYSLVSYVCTKSAMWPDLHHGDNCFILENQTIQPGVRIGNNATIWSGNHLGHGCSIGDHAFITSHVCISGHTQIGLVAVASVEAYQANRIRKHEFTRPDKEDDRVRQIDALNAQTGPVFLTYRHSPAVDDLAARITASAPEVEVTADDGVQHALWVVRDPDHIGALTAAFEVMDCLYVADGHHRSAAAARVAAERREKNPNHTGKESYNYFLTVIFPDDQMQILDYNRVVKDLNGLAAKDFMEKLSAAFTLQPETAAVRPKQAGEFGMYLQGKWYRLCIKPERVPTNDPVKRLDVSLLQENVVAPILGITDPRRDKRIDFVGGIRGLQELERRVDSGEMAVAFSLYPTSLADLMAVADAGEVMPPKSTWFEPKLADGLVSLSLG